MLLTIVAMSIAVPETYRISYELFIVLVGFPVITSLAIQAATPAYLVKPFLLLGVTSYAVYALHRPVLSVVNGAAQVLHIPLANYAPWSGIPFLILFFAFCWMIDLVHDQPVRRLLGKRVRVHDTPSSRSKRQSVEIS